jgi:hypothetical protein
MQKPCLWFLAFWGKFVKTTNPRLEDRGLSHAGVWSRRLPRGGGTAQQVVS